MWDAASGRQLLLLAGHENPVASVDFSPEGDTIVLGGWDNSVRLWDAAFGHCLLDLKGHAYAVIRLAFSPDGKHLLTEDSFDVLRCWNTADGSPTEIPEEAKGWLEQSSRGQSRKNGLTLITGRSRTFRIAESNRILRDILPLPDGNFLVLEPWDEAEGGILRTDLFLGPFFAHQIWCGLR